MKKIMTERRGFKKLRQMADFVLCARDNGLTVVSKLGELSKADTARLLEMGVMGIQLPRTKTADDMRTLIDFIKYPPVGSRASATAYGNSFYGKVDKSTWYDEANAETFSVSHFETRKPAKNSMPWWWHRSMRISKGCTPESSRGRKRRCCGRASYSKTSPRQ